MDKFLVDSDAIIWFLRGRNKETNLIETLAKSSNLYCSVVSIAEIRAGLRKQPEKILRELRDIFPAVDITFDIAEKAGQYKQKYRLDIADMLIAATASISGLTLITHNKKHFPMPDVNLYKF